MSDSQGGGVPRFSGQWIGLPEAFAWISTRDVSFVALHVRSTPIGLSLALSRYSLNAGDPIAKSVGTAQASLLAKLKHGEVQARGRPGNKFDASGPASDIDVDRWAFLRFGEVENRFRAQAEDGQTIDYWHDVLVQSDELMTAFPPLVPSLKQDEKVLYQVETLGVEKEATTTSETVPPQFEDGKSIEAPEASADKSAGKASKPRSRRGAPSLQTDDDGAVQEMRRLIDASEARSPTQAANMVFSYMRVEGLGGDESRIRRLVRRYMKRFPAGGSE